MNKPIRVLAIPGAALALGLAVSGAVQGQPAPLPLTPPPNTPVAPFFAPDSPSPPAYPQPAVTPRRALTLHDREDALDAALDAGLRDGAIDKTVGVQARMDLDALRYTEDRLRQRNHGELTDAETFRIDGRLQALTEVINGRPR